MEKTLKDYEYYRTELGVLYCGDCLDILPLLDKESIDLILTDPPYGISYNKKGEVVIIGDRVSVLGRVLDDYYRILKKDGAIYIFTSFKLLTDWTYRFQTYFKMNNLLIWDKQRNSGLQMGSNWGYSYEMIFYGSKGFHKLNGYSDDILRFERCKNKEKTHPTEKPIPLLNKIYEMSGNKGTILDNFCGTGSALISAIKNKQKFIGIEISKEYCKIAKKRIKEEADQLKMF